MSKKNKKNQNDELDELDEFEEAGWEEIEEDEFDLEFQPQLKPKKKEKKLPLKILYQDEAIVVIDKPSGMDSTRGQFASEETVLDRMEVELPDLAEPIRLVHRLDRETSGAMVLAKTKDAQRTLSEQWQTRTVEKTYLAITHGVVPTSEGVIDVPLKNTQSQKRPVLPDPARGKSATTEFKILEQYRQYTLVEAHPITGRMHQVRVHFASQGTPLLVDKLYGSSEPLLLSQFKRRYRSSHRKGDEKPLIARLALHAHTLAFDHPTTGERMTFTVEPPKDFTAAMKQLEKYGR
jgi:23S rRNA pseudouridine955/2504/2580 synthase/23S rRNA pseudouridine1911/1915/1917 synthase